MNRQPQRVSITEEREKQIKEKFGYSVLYTFSPSFLEEYKEKIITYFPNPAEQQYLMENMGRITEFFIADRTQNGMSRLCCNAESIQMDIQFADITDTSFSLKEGCEYIETILIHELLHAATRQRGNNKNLTGVLEFIRDEEGKVVKGPNNRKNVGLNEGLTQYFAERISGRKVPNDIDSYTFNKNVVYLLADVLGEDVLKSSYFGNNNNLKDLLNELAQDEDFYEDFNKRLDTITRMETTIRRIKNQEITPQNPEALERMEAVANAQKTALMEMVFAKVIIPQVQKIELPAITNHDDQEQIMLHNKALAARQAILLPILEKYPELLKSIAKYISNGQGISEFATDTSLRGIQQEILSNGMSFDKIAQVARKVNDNYKLGPKIAKDFIGAVDEFYVNNPNALKDNSTTITPLLHRQLERMVEILDILETVKARTLSDPNSTEEQKEQVIQGVENHYAFMEKHFHKIPNLREEIERIREEKRQKTQTEEPSPELHPEASSILDEAKRAGENEAKRTVNEPKKTEQQPEEETKVTRDFTLKDRFIIDNQTGAIIDQQNLSLSQKVQNLTRATGEFDIGKDPVLTEMAQNSSKSYAQGIVPTFTPERCELLKKSLGPDWEQKLQAAYEEGYRAGLQMALANSKNAGLAERAATTEALKTNQPIEESRAPISFEELKYASANFDIKTTETGEMVVVDKVTSQPVHSERTKATALFAREWVKINGERAFTPEQAEVYRFVQVEASKSLQEEGTISPAKVVTDATMMGESFKAATEKIFVNSQVSPVIENFFRVQTVNAKARTEVPVEAQEAEKASHR